MKLSIQAKAMGAFSIVIVIFVGVGIYLLFQLNQTNQHLNYLATNTVPSITQISDIQVLLNQYRRYEFNHILAATAQDKDVAETKLNDIAKEVDQNFKDYEALVSDEKDGQYLADIKDAWAKYTATTPGLLTASRANSFEAAGKEIANTLDEFNSVIKLGDDWMAYNTQLGDDFAAQSQAGTRLALQLGIVFMVVAAIVGLGLAYYLARSVSGAAKLMAKTAEHISEVDLAALVAATTALAQGDLTSRLHLQTQPVDYASGDELGQLAQSFNRMIGQFHQVGQAFEAMSSQMRQTVGQLVKTAGGLNEASGQLSAASEQAGQAASQMASTIQQVATGTANQSEGIAAMMSSMQQMSHAITGVAQGAQEQAKAIGRSTEVTARMSEAIGQVAANVTRLEAVREKVGLSTRKVNEMGRRSQQIGAIVKTIDDIAAQTNLLALNAAIEAARAGEHGKGFAVVADEVRKLAEKSASATKEIAELIHNMQAVAGEAVTAMEESAAGVDSQVEQISQATRAMSVSSDELVQVMETVSAVVEENTASTEELSAGSAEVADTIRNIASVSEQNSAAAQEVSAGTEEMSAQVQEVSASAQELRGMAQMLQSLVDQYQLDGR